MARRRSRGSTSRKTVRRTQKARKARKARRRGGR